MLPGRPSFAPLLVISDISSALSELTNIGDLTAGVGVFGPPAAYALVWELGSRRLKKPGPKTMWSTNRNKERVILTRQAPHGYVGPNVSQFWPIIKRELRQVNFDVSTGHELILHLQVAMDNAAHKIASIIAEDAPKDSGDLTAGIQAIDTDEASTFNLDESSDFEAGGAVVL